MTATERTAGVVLCGGLSARMGRAKAWLAVAGEPMLLRVVRVVADAVGPVVVVAAPGQHVPALPDGVELVRDAAEGNGPLQGLATGLAAVEGQADAAVVVGCDTPFITAPFLQRLVSLRGDAPACAVAVDGFSYPLPAVYAVGLLGEVRQLLASRRLRLGGLLERVPSRLVGAGDFADVDSTLASLRNVNTPDDYARALADLGRASAAASGRTSRDG